MLDKKARLTTIDCQAVRPEMSAPCDLAHRYNFSISRGVCQNAGVWRRNGARVYQTRATQRRQDSPVLVKHAFT